MRSFRSPNSGQTSLTLQHSTSPRSGYRPPVGHNADGYTMAQRVPMAKGGKVKTHKEKTINFFQRQGMSKKEAGEQMMRRKSGPSRPNYKKGGWIQDVNKSIKKRGTKGKCTPITKKGCTGRAKALAKTFKKMAKKRKGK
jgi:hypothetical protein